jgi:metallo-beta-lactamase family protein
MIELEVLGAAQTVTGSRHVLHTSRAKVLLDCGLFQGHRAEANAKNRAIQVDPRALDAVVLSHAHLDHSGALPILCQQGYGGPIYATPATRDLCAPMLEDAAAVQEADARHITRLIARGVDLRPVEPLYGHDAVVTTLSQMIGVPYHRRHTIAPGVDDGERVRLAFTGDLGRPDLPILRDPEPPDGVRCLITESTYGDRLHSPFAETGAELARAIARTVARGGKVIIPTFALERAQEIVFSRKRLRADGRLSGTIPVYLDSPLATRFTDVLRLHPDCYDAATFELVRGGDTPFDFPGLEYVHDVEDSKAITADPRPAIVIAGSGMCEGGRVLHHLRAAVADPRNAIVIVGFQAEHTLGRRIVERRPSVRIFGITHELHAEVVVLDGFSSHADQRGLVDFAEAVRARGPLQQIVLVHGEPPAQQALAAQLAAHHFPTVTAPAPGAHLRI